MASVIATVQCPSVSKRLNFEYMSSHCIKKSSELVVLVALRNVSMFLSDKEEATGKVQLADLFLVKL